MICQFNTYLIKPFVFKCNPNIKPNSSLRYEIIARGTKPIEL